MDTDLLMSVRSGKKRDGQILLVKHLNGVRLTRSQAIRAKCYGCDGMGDSGICEIKTCSLYPYSSYAK
jgi:hypothetical protein